MLNPSDVYVSGGSDKLLVCWTDKVTKYDASSFYNWEQDNLPLHDLDERTHLAWEKFGHPTSSLTGMSFIVSADATDSCSPLYFTTLSSCVAALPEVINCPILVEVASFGSLGGLEISNKAFGPNGSLEIINRNSSFGGSIDIDGSSMCAQEADSVFTSYSLASSIIPVSQVAADIVSHTSGIPSLAFDAQVARLYSNGQFISSGYGDGSGWNDSRYISNPHYVFSKQVDGDRNSRLTAALSSAGSPWDSGVITYREASSLNFIPYEKFNEDTVYDASTFNFRSQLDISWGAINPAAGAAAFAYFNNLDYIKINECNGPIYIRNFNVDSAHVYTRGIEIKNSKVSLERCSVSRANEAGLYADSSEVDLLRGFVAYRNYKILDSVRTGTPYAEKREAYKSQESYGAGIFAINSTVNFKSTYQRDIDKSTDASTLIYPNYAGNVPAPSMESLYCMSRNDIGIHAVNSKVVGGRVETGGSSTPIFWRDGTQVFSELNTEAGIRLENSVLENSGRLLLDGNYFGIDSYHSKLFVDSLAARYNQSTALKLHKSYLTYNKDLYQGYLGTTEKNVGPENYVMSQLAFGLNGTDVLADQSKIAPLMTSSMPSIYQMVFASGAFGDNTGLLPSIQAINNSNLDLVHLHVNRVTTDSTGREKLGLFVSCEDDSTVTCRGSKEYANIFAGPNDSTGAEQAHVAGLYSNNNSTIKLQGPTASYQVGINALANNNSNIEITPHQGSNGELLVSAFDLADGANHTMVELHSTRACLISNRNSSLVMEDLGDRTINWSGAVGGSLTETYDFSGQPTYTSGGFLQFYPNAFAIGNANVAHLVTSISTKYSFNSTGSILNKGYSYLFPDTGDFSGITTGGMCVRALGDSLVKANNVHFPAGWSNTSALAYDLNGTEPLPGPDCSRLFIWNIADNSLLKASYLSVSGNHPRDAGYFGPSGVWGNVSGAPSSTPDTSSLSILDYYGSTNLHKYAKNTAENFGTFRLYFSTNPAANYLDTSNSGFTGLPRQIFAQGYNFSGNLSATSNSDYDGSSYTALLQDHNGVVTASGFYYASAMMLSPDTIKAVLDDSAANTFANAKHNSVGKSGLAKVVHIYSPVKGIGGDSKNDYTYGLGLASVNNFDLDKDN